MNVSRRTITAAMASSVLFPAFDTCCYAKDSVAASPDRFEGIWSAHHRQTFIFLIIQPNHKAIFALLDQGYSFGEVPWFAADNGVIVGGFPMLRLWTTNQPDRCKVRMQAVPPEATNDTFIKFPLSFYMTRQLRKPLPAALSDLNAPEDWLGAEPPSDFDDMAGRTREIEPG